VCESFPNRYVADWQPPADDPDGDIWYDLPDSTQWDLAFAGLRARGPHLHLTPDSLAGISFGHPVTIYDLLAPDRDARVARAFGDAR
jgi:hypothetical protein